MKSNPFFILNTYTVITAPKKISCRCKEPLLTHWEQLHWEFSCSCSKAPRNNIVTPTSSSNFSVYKKLQISSFFLDLKERKNSILPFPTTSFTFTNHYFSSHLQCIRTSPSHMSQNIFDTTYQSLFLVLEDDLFFFWIITKYSYNY